MMRHTTLDQTIEVKNASETELAKHNVNIKDYRVDNGRFSVKGFKDEVANVNQTITRCRVRAHCQNSPAKNALVKSQP